MPAAFPVLKFANALFWELAQNASGVVPFVLAVWLWAQRKRGMSILCLSVGGVASSLVIYLTESAKTGHAGSFPVLIANVVVISLLQLLIVPYLGSQARWSNSKTDWLIGALAGVALAVAQGLAAAGQDSLASILLHSAALAVGCALVLVNVRALKHKALAPALAGSGLIAFVMSLAIALVDYSYLVISP